MQVDTSFPFESAASWAFFQGMFTWSTLVFGARAVSPLKFYDLAWSET